VARCQIDCIWGGYGVATISRLLKILGLFCRISSLLQGSFAEETYNFKAPTHRSHPIRGVVALKLYVSFAEYSLLYRVLLQKRPIILGSLLVVATPYHDYSTDFCEI